MYRVRWLLAGPRNLSFSVVRKCIMGVIGATAPSPPLGYNEVEAAVDHVAGLEEMANP
jgi:hypothetical protein